MEVRVPAVRPGGAAHLVEVDGDLDIATVGDLEAPLIDAIRDGRHQVILDLSDCTFIDSSGIRLLLRAHHLLRENGGGNRRAVLVVVARDHVARLLEVTGIDKALLVVPSRADAAQRLE